MDLYYVNNDNQDNDKHAVHKLGCDYFPVNYLYLGAYAGSQDALQKARQYFPRVEGCENCCASRLRRVHYNPN